MILAVLLCMAGAMNVSANEKSLEEVPFWAHEVWGAAEPMTTEAECAWVVGEPTGQPYGDSGVNNFADLSRYSQLVVVATEGTPRFLFNRDKDDGQFSDTEAESHLIDNTRGGWCSKYFSTEETEEGTVYTVDLKQMMKDKGFCHLHAIKGANWQNVTVTSMVVIGESKANVAEFSNDVVEVFFEFDTNIPELVEASGAMRVFFDNSCATVKVNDQEKEIYSVEGFADGRFYIFLNDAIDKKANVEVTVRNTMGLVFTAGPNMGSTVPDFNGIATWNDDIEDDGGYPYIMETPTLMKSDPEDGAFNLSSDTPITLYFDKLVDCAALVVTANGSELTKNPADGFAQQITVSGSLPSGVCAIVVDKVYPEERIADEIFGTYEFTLNIGQSSFDPNSRPEEVIPVSYFETCAGGSVPEGYILYADGDPAEERTPGGNYGSGARMMDFSTGGDFTKGLYMRTWYLEYGTTSGYELNLSAGTKYRTTFNSCQWNSGGHWMQFAIFDASNPDTPVFTQMVENSPNINESRNAVNGSTASTIDFTPASSGQYIVRWILCTGSDGTPTNNAWQNGVILANVKMVSMSAQPGYEYFLMLMTALDNAKKTLEENGDDRYQGYAYDNLQAAISQYESEMGSYHGPSQFENAAAALEEACTALKAHCQLCKDYDEQIKKAIDVIRKNEMPDGDPAKATRFVYTELFAQLKEVVAMYNGYSEWENIGSEEEPQWQLNYSYDMLTDDGELTDAIAELKDIATLTGYLFTEGESKGTDTGVKVLIERMRRGVETLKALGVAEDDPILQEYKYTLEDNDDLAQAMMDRIKLELYRELADPNSGLFDGVINEETLEEVVPVFDMTVFVKNPNIYKQEPNMNLTSDNVPGWDVSGSTGLWCGWNGAVKNIEGVAEDCAFTVYHAEGVAEQTLYDLPAGTYNVIVDAARWDNADPSGATFAYIKLLNTPDEEYAETQDLAYYGQYVMNHDNVFENVVITDGYLTLGVNFASDEGQYFFDKVVLQMVGKAPSFDYAKAYAQGIETMENNRVSSVELYDLNGRRIDAARQGVVIMKKHMSDGTVKAEKLVRK